jgi:hypothetical protein
MTNATFGYNRIKIFYEQGMSAVNFTIRPEKVASTFDLGQNNQQRICSPVYKKHFKI